MDKRKWIAIGATALAIVVGILIIKFCPLYSTYMSILAFILGGVAGYFIKDKEVIETIIEKEVPVVKEVIKEVPVTKTKKTKKTE